MLALKFTFKLNKATSQECSALAGTLSCLGRRKRVVIVADGGFRMTRVFIDNISSRDMFLEIRGMNFY